MPELTPSQRKQYQLDLLEVASTLDDGAVLEGTSELAVQTSSGPDFEDARDFSMLGLRLDLDDGRI